MTLTSLDRIFKPRTIALVGASNRKESVGYALMHNLLVNDYTGTVYPINPAHHSVAGVRAFPSVLDLPEPVDLAIIATPAKSILKVVEECGHKKIGGLVLLSAGFSETGRPEGAQLLSQIRGLAHEFGMRFLGPNCLGFINPSLNLNASFARTMALPGKVAFISQSGALCTAILDWSRRAGVGFSHFISIGSMADIGFGDLIDYLGAQPQTESIILYMESLTEARRFMSAARAFAREKPIVALKAGRSSCGAVAALSHTGNLSGDDRVFDIALRRAGVVRVENLSELFDAAQTLALQPRPKGNRLAIVTNAGGPGVLAVDSLIQRGGELAPLSLSTLENLDKVLPSAWSRANPLDLLGDAGVERYREALVACLQDPNVDGVLVILTPQSMTDSVDIARQVVSLNRKWNKTILASWMGAAEVEQGRGILETAGLPVYETPEDAVRSFLYMVNYAHNLELLTETPEAIAEFLPHQSEKARHILDHAMEEGRYSLTEKEAKDVVSFYNIPVPRNSLANLPEEAVNAAEKIGYPVALKIISPEILHKTETGGVALGLRSRYEVLGAYGDIMAKTKKTRPEARLQGILVEEMVPRPHELFVGAKKDPIFGPVILFGTGGTAVEIFRDVNAGLPPLNMALALDLIRGTKIYTLLKGYRGQPAAALLSLQSLLYHFAYLLMDFPQISEVDLNPVGIDEKGLVVADAKILLDQRWKSNPVAPYSHLVISPYPKQYESRAKLSDGREVFLRPICPEDEPLHREMFKEFSQETQRFRFFRLIKEATHQLLIQFTQIDYDREIAIVAVLDEENRKRFIGVGRLIADPEGTSAEFAVVVADKWQGQGLGRILTDRMLEIAVSRGIPRIIAYMSKENSRVQTLFRNRGFHIFSEEDCLRAEKSIG